MKSNYLVRGLALLMAALGVFASGVASAQNEWPKAKPVNIIVGFGPGAFTDVIARVVAQKLGEMTGGSFVVENKPGAGGNIATAQVKRAAPDGYTILVHSVAYAVNPSLYPNAGYDAIKDFVPLALGPRTPNIITVNPNTPAKDLKELIDLARTEKLSYASSGIGTTTHLSMERLKMAAKVNITHVPYQPAQAINAVVAGHTQMSSTSMPPAVPQIKAGKLRASPSPAPNAPRCCPTFPRSPNSVTRTSTTTPGSASSCPLAPRRRWWTRSTPRSTRRWSCPTRKNASSAWAWSPPATALPSSAASCAMKSPNGPKWSRPRAPKSSKDYK